MPSPEPPLGSMMPNWLLFLALGRSRYLTLRGFMSSAPVVVFAMRMLMIGVLLPSVRNGSRSVSPLVASSGLIGKRLYSVR